METAKFSKEEIGRKGKLLYEQSVRSKVETSENIGKMVIIDVETGDYSVDETGLVSSRRSSGIRTSRLPHPRQRLPTLCM